jgi:hypothetical protein
VPELLAVSITEIKNLMGSFLPEDE